jgi:hypothetical protein
MKKETTEFEGWGSISFISDEEMPSPTKQEMDSPEFNAIFDIIKDWDIKVPKYSSGYKGGNGSHVKLILDSIKAKRRENNINTTLDGIPK